MRSLIVLSLVLSACTATVSTPRQSVAACYSSVTAVANSAADLDARGQLSADTKKRVRDAATQALAMCDAAKAAISAGDVSKADGALKAAEALLLSVEANLKVTR